MAIIEIFPICNEPAPELARLAAVNARLRAFADSHDIAFIATARPPLINAGGSLDPALSADGQHLNEAGYSVIAAWIASEGGPATAPLRPH